MAPAGQRTPKPLLIVIIGLIALESMVVLGLLLVEPSESGGFLGFSPGRWGLILFHLISSTFLFYFIYKTWKDDVLSHKVSVWLEDEAHLFWLWLAFAVFVTASLWMLLGKTVALTSPGVFDRLRPTLIWFALAGVQIWLSTTFLLRSFFTREISRLFPLPQPVQLTSVSRRIEHPWFMAGIALIYFILQTKSHWNVREALWLPDSIDYVFPASFGWTDPVLWTHTKPWGAAVFYKLVGTSPFEVRTVSR